MNTLEFLEYLRTLDVKLRADGDRLHCNAPEGVLSPDIQSELAARKADILSLLSDISDTDGLPPIIREARKQHEPLSYAQQRMWLIQKLDPNSRAYNLPSAIRLSGDLDIPALKRSLQDIVSRHEILRTVFVEHDGNPVQVVLTTQPCELQHVDISDVPSETRSERLRELYHDEARQAFDLRTGPLLSCMLVTESDTAHVLIVTFHHIIFDGWSVGVFIKEFTALYNGYCAHGTPVLPELAVQYADYAIWQRTWLEEHYRKQLAYWKQQLAGDIPVLALPHDHPRPAVTSFRGGQVPFHIDKDTTDRLREIGRRAGASLFMVLLAALDMLLHRYSNSTKIPVGTVIANRNRPEIEDLIGFFLNTLVLYNDVSGNPTFAELLKKVAGVTVAAYDHQDVPFERLLEELHPARSQNQTPFFQVMFILQNAPIRDFELTGVHVTPVLFESDTAKFDVNIHMFEVADGLEGMLFYNADIFEHTTAQRMCRHFRTLIERVADDPGKRLSEYHLSTDHEQVAVSNKPAMHDAPIERDVRDGSVVTRFETIVAEHADRLAIKSLSEEFTYHELNVLANRIAHTLLERCDSGNRIALLFTHGAAMIAGMVGVLKTGNAYVPLDPDFPRNRLTSILADSECTAIITTGENIMLANRLADNTIPVIDVDTLVPDTPDNNPDISVAPDALAYILYTSGSTGTPKGVMQTHRGMLHFIRAYANSQDITAQDRLLLLASYCFDASVMDIYGTILTGAALYPFSLGRNDIGLLGNWIHTHRISVFHATPTVYRLFAETVRSDESTDLSSIRAVVLGGETFHLEDVGSFRELFAEQCRLTNLLGQTESSVTLLQTVEVPGHYGGSFVPVGFPVEDTDVFLVDAEGRRTDVYGEITVKSRYVTPGYWNRQELTDRVLSANPAEAGVRMLRTGDMGRMLDDGALAFAGRKDHQIKLHGFRIEIDEIEATILKHRSIARVGVVLHESERLGQLLAAYFDTGAETVDIAELRQFLKERLPDYMIPTLLIALDEFPLTPTGKIDRVRLAARELPTGLVSETHVSPQSHTEELLAIIWGTVLNRTSVGMNDDFFELGGHSLLATQIMSRIRDTFRIELPLREIFDHPSIQQLAERIDHARLEEKELITNPIAPVFGKDGYPLSYSQYRMWFLQQLIPESTAYSLPGAVRVKGSIDVDALTESFRQLIERHEILNTRFAFVDNRPLQILLDKICLPVMYYDFRTIPEHKRELQAREILGEDAVTPFVLDEGNPLRIWIIQLGENDYILYMNMHHIVTDQWSGAIIVGEVNELYRAILEQRPHTLSKLDIQYGDFAHWQRQALTDDVIQSMFGYWESQLAGMAPLDLPVDFPRARIQKTEGGTVRKVFSAALVEKLRSFCAEEHVTLFMVMLAGFKVLLHQYSLQDDISVGSPVANRTQSEVEHLIGTFVNTLVIRTDLSGEPTFRELLHRVKGTLLDAFENQDMPFEKLVELLHPDRDIGQMPLVNVLFNMHNAPPRGESQVDMDVSVFDIGRRNAQFDLTMTLEMERSRQAMLIFNTGLFREDTARRLIEHYHQLLEQVAENPDRHVSELRVIDDREKQCILYDWNATSAEYPKTSAYHELFRKQALDTPDAVAIVCNGREMTYHELDRRSNQLAHYLRGKGAVPNTFVGILVERSLDMVVGLLGIMKAGAAYLPLDPMYPPERIQYMLEDSGADILVTQALFGDSFSETVQNIVYLDTDAETIGRESEDVPENANQSSDLAYIIYTSGSTGKPKGVQISHRALINFLASMSREPGMTADDTMLSVTTISFDIAGLELYVPLMTGGRVVIANNEQTTDGRQLLDLIKQSSVTIMQATPATWWLLLEAGWQADTSFKILCGGEAMSPDLAEKLLERGSSVWNMYGPTETTVWSTLYRVQSASDPILIGRPIANTQVYILDKQLYPVPIGVQGELYIAGDGLANGYWKRPDLTDDRFVPDPFSRNGGRIYNTGDLARYLPDGNIECLGRVDNQVKVRGHRIELGEIESVIAMHPSIKQSVVIVREDTPGDKRITAYLITLPDEGDVPLRDIREHTRKELPEYMVPSYWVVVDEFPLTPNGKINRRALPAPEPDAMGLDDTYVAPRTDMEEKVAAIWATVLQIERVGIHDNFFDLGGHSMLATELITRINAELNLDLKLRALFLDPTVAGLMQEIEQPDITGERYKLIPPNLLIPIQASGTKPPLFVVSGAHERDEDYLRYLSCLLPSIPNDQPIFGLRPGGLATNETAFKSVESMAAEYVKIMKTIVPNGPYLIAGECVGGIVAFEIAQQLHAEGTRVSLLVLLDTFCPNAVLDTMYWIQHSYAYKFLMKFRKLITRNPLRYFLHETKRLNRQVREWIKPSEDELAMRRHAYLQYKYRRILFKYRPKSWYNRLTLIVNTEYHAKNPTLGWERVAKENISTHLVPGNHLSRLTVYGKYTGQTLTECIERALQHENPVS